jgi:hypothetical protein
VWDRFVTWLESTVSQFFAPPVQQINPPAVPMPRPVIAIINASSVLKDSDIAPIVQALQIQVTNHFAPVYGQDATLVQVKKDQIPPAGSWWLVFLDSSDVAGILGYHDVTSEGLPLGKVFAGLDLHYGNLPSVTASHELLEMLADPYCNKSARRETRFYAYEVGDPVQSDDLGYYIGAQIKVSDFVYPAWFSRTGKGKMDYCGHLIRPFQLGSGGYISVLDPSSGGGWQQEFGDEDDGADGPKARAKVGSRRERRRTPLEHWLQSEAHVQPAFNRGEAQRDS